MIYFFDLDATLLQIDQNQFLKNYMGLIAKYAAENSLDIEVFMKKFEVGIYNMVTNKGDLTNREAFWTAFEGYDISYLEELFGKFYANEFNQISSLVTKTEFPNKIIKKLKEEGHTIVLATTPLFPKEATLSRVSWAGLDASDFIEITSYEDYKHAKPRPEYFLDIITKCNLPKEEEYVMVGNDLFDDFAYLPKSFKKILIKEHLINEKNLPITEDITVFNTLEEFYNSL